ncbi:MAG: hypothetical protein GYA21_12195 [Myxococcales bacterium]|nr:hypothetical protein [Myxococcales bacterium]
MIWSWFLPGIVAALSLCACGDGGRSAYTEPSREERQGIHVLRLLGTPYQMGWQHGRLMAAELAEGVEFVKNDPLFSLFLPMARSQGLIEDALAQSYPEVLDECRGMAAGAADAGVEGWDLETCVALAYGDVIIAFINDLLGNGCTQFVASGPATPAGVMVHGRNMDWDRLSYLIRHPTVIVRRPEGGVPFASVGFPGNVAPYNGINAAGLSVASNNNGANPDTDPNQRSRRGHTQMIYQMLSRCGSLAQAEEFLLAQTHARATILVVADGERGEAAVFEVSPSHHAARRLDADGLVYATNHFLDPGMDPYDNEPGSPQDSTVCRLERLRQLLPPGGAETRYGQIDAAAAVAVLRDRKNGCTGEVYPPEEFDTNGSIANNGAIWSMVFVPMERLLYLAAGEPPVPSHPYVGFGMDELLHPGAPPPSPSQIP